MAGLKEPPPAAAAAAATQSEDLLCCASGGVLCEQKGRTIPGNERCHNCKELVHDSHCGVENKEATKSTESTVCYQCAKENRKAQKEASLREKDSEKKAPAKSSSFSGYHKFTTVFKKLFVPSPSSERTTIDKEGGSDEAKFNPFVLFVEGFLFRAVRKDVPSERMNEEIAKMRPTRSLPKFRHLLSTPVMRLDDDDVVDAFYALRRGDYALTLADPRHLQFPLCSLEDATSSSSTGSTRKLYDMNGNGELVLSFSNPKLQDAIHSTAERELDLAHEHERIITGEPFLREINMRKLFRRFIYTYMLRPLEDEEVTRDEFVNDLSKFTLWLCLCQGPTLRSFLKFCASYFREFELSDIKVIELRQAVAAMSCQLMMLQHVTRAYSDTAMTNVKELNKFLGIERLVVRMRDRRLGQIKYTDELCNAPRDVPETILVPHRQDRQPRNGDFVEDSKAAGRKRRNPEMGPRDENPTKRYNPTNHDDDLTDPGFLNELDGHQSLSTFFQDMESVGRARTIPRDDDFGSSTGSPPTFFANRITPSPTDHGDQSGSLPDSESVNSSARSRLSFDQSISNGPGDASETLPPLEDIQEDNRFVICGKTSEAVHAKGSKAFRERIKQSFVDQYKELKEKTEKNEFLKPRKEKTEFLKKAAKALKDEFRFVVINDDRKVVEVDDEKIILEKVRECIRNKLRPKK